MITASAARTSQSAASTGPRLRILELINSLNAGGAERMAGCLSLQLRELGHEVHVVCLRDFGVMQVPAERFTESGVSLTELGKKDGLNLAVLWRLARILKERHIDVVHSHNPLVTHYATAAGKIAGTPIIITTVHGTNTLIMQQWAEKLFVACCRWNHGVVLVCDAVEQVFRQRYAGLGDRSSAIPNGIETGDLVQVRRRAGAGEFVFGTIGRLVAVKDHRTLLAAFAKVHEEHPSCRLEILGPGELLEELQAFGAALGVLSSVKFHGFSRDIARFFAGVDTFVLSSKSEGLPMTVLEAMAAGLPIVATDVGGIPEVVEGADCGWLSKPGDAEGLAANMLRAMDASDRRERGERGRQAVIERYSVQAMATQYESLFQELFLARAASRRPSN